ncbi:MAG TPA: bifunctional UDP-N-acetylglucosamine diphosphorylase/glucosamine-1-phosphate N-acetyltransferase GlmU [Streptosporangiaceae bacterium]|nr:bifunctional UDP-N-acetylglucosamine diphosphorylase/glucosamine-1-phosphate N-acetyltransferase GlmU [Streptosporangiaceae bacterium]
MSEPRPVAVVVLAAGEGTRMKSRIPKVLHALAGRSLLGHALAVAGELGPQRLVVVAGHGKEQVSAEAARHAPGVCVVVQDRLAGTGHAVRMVTEELGAMPGIVVVTYADMPLLRAQTLAGLVREHAAAGNAVTVLTARVGDPAGYGRVVRDDGGSLAEIVEDADATPAQRAIDEINSGCYAFDGVLLADAVKRVATGNAQGQEYLTDVVAIMRGDGHRAGTVLAADPAEIQGVNDRVQLAAARRAYNDRLLEHWMRAGVTIVDPATTWIDADVQIGQDTEIRPGTQLEGRTVVGEGAKLGPGCQLRDTTVADGALVWHAVCVQSEIGPDATVGPYAYLRPGTRIGAGAHIGCHVELKNSVVGAGAKVPHLSYVGDAEIGEHANIGAATIFANYDGVAKHRTRVGAHAFTGSDTTLVAPVTVGDGAYTAAGSVITEDIPPGALGIARGRQHNSEGWVERQRPGSASAARARRAAGSPRDQDKRDEDKGALGT